jgi:hypothetical protein
MKNNIVALASADNGSSAKTVYENLSKEIVDFHKQLKHDEEVVLLSINIGGQLFYVVGINYLNPDMIVFSVVNNKGQLQHIMQHYTLVTVLLDKLCITETKPIQTYEKPKPPFGFRLTK